MFIYSRTFINLTGSPCDISLSVNIWTVHTLFENLLLQFYLICERKIMMAVSANNEFHTIITWPCISFHIENSDFKHSEFFSSLAVCLILWIVLHKECLNTEQIPVSLQVLTILAQRTSNLLLNYYNIFRNSLKYLLQYLFNSVLENC